MWTKKALVIKQIRSSFRGRFCYHIWCPLVHIESILPKGPCLPCVSPFGRIPSIYHASVDDIKHDFINHIWTAIMEDIVFFIYQCFVDRYWIWFYSSHAKKICGQSVKCYSFNYVQHFLCGFRGIWEAGIWIDTGKTCHEYWLNSRLSISLWW